MLMQIVGNLGSGKTLFNVYTALWASENGIPVFANFHIKLPNCTFLQIDDIKELDVKEAIVFLDEAYWLFDSRRSMSKLSRTFTFWAFQSRKRGLDVIVTAQVGGAIDNRIRFLSQYYIACFKRSSGFHYYLISPNWKTYHFILRFERAKKLFDLYDHKEMFVPEGALT